MNEKRQAALYIVSQLVNKGYIALFAGGYVRDMLLECDDKGDIDICTNATPQAIMGLFAHTVAVGAQFGVVVVVHCGIPFEVATFRSDVGIHDGRHPHHIVFSDAREDALRRDFTINGMFYDPLGDKLSDYVGGREDLKAGIIRAIGDPCLRFREDYLRLLRAVRFAARLDFSIDSATWEALREQAGNISSISAERIFAEFDKMLRQPHPDRAMKLLQESGLLRQTLPEVDDLVGLEQPAEFHPEGDVFTHTVMALGLMAEVFRPGPCPDVANGAQGEEAEPDPSHEKPSAVLAWSVLLHDIGKKPTMRRMDRIRFNNHDQVGAEMARGILKRLRAPNDLIDGVVACIENHMNFMNVMEMRLSTLKKLMSRPTIHEELELHRVDCLSSHGNIDNYHFVQSRMAVLAQERIKPAPVLRGQDLIVLGFKQGPIFGKILGEVYDLQLDEKLPTREAALAYVVEKWGRAEASAVQQGTPSEPGKKEV